MTINTTSTTVTYAGNGSTTVFTFPFVGVAAADLEVIYTDSTGSSVTLNPSTYTLTLNAVGAGQLWAIGGSVTYPNSGPAIATGTTLTINRKVPYTQTVSIGNQGAFYPQAMEQGLDLLAMEVQQIETAQLRSIQVPVTDATLPAPLPGAAARANGVMGFDSSGVNPTILHLGPTTPVPSSVTITHANTPYAATGTPSVIYANAIAGVITINLPSAGTVQEIYIAKTDSSTNAVTIAATGGQTINGASTYSLSTQYANAILISNGGTAWQLFSGGASSSPTGLAVAKITVANTPYTVAGAINVVVVDASGGSVTVNLPAAVAIQAIYVVRTDSVKANSVTIIANNGSAQINGTGSYVLQFQHQGVMCVSDGVINWNIFGQIKPITDPLTPNMKTVNNIFNLINDPSIIAKIQNNTYGYLDSYFTQMCAIGGVWFLPQGYYHLANTVNMTPAMELWGAGSAFSDDPTQSGTAIYLGGSAGQWGLQQSNPLSTNQYEAYKVRDICFQATQNGLRWNRIDGGFTDDADSQGYMMRPRIERCGVLLDAAPGTGIGVQMSKCFDFVVRDCYFTNFSSSCDMEGSDIGVIESCRFDTETAYSILANSHGTFGSSLAIYNCDFNDPYGFVNTTYLDTLIDNNHMEFDRDRTRTTAAIVVSGDAFHTKIHNNRIQPGALVANWLSVTNDVNRFLVSVHNNTTSAPSQMGNVSYPSQVYLSNGGQRALVSHSCNSAGDQNFPMNWVDGYQQLPPGHYAIVTPSTAGVDGGASNLNPNCEFGAFTIHPNADSTRYMQISDWLGYGLPANTMKGTVTISLTTAAGAAGQQGSWQVLDNGSSVASGTITHGVANQMYTTAIVTSHNFSGPVQVRLWNSDTGTGERFYIYGAYFKIG